MPPKILMQVQLSQYPKDSCLRKTCHKQRLLSSVHLFLHSSRFYLTPKVLCFRMLFNQPDNPKGSHSHGASTSPCNTCLLDPPNSAFQTAYCHFCTARGRKCLYFTVCIKMRIKKCSTILVVLYFMQFCTLLTFGCVCALS